MPSPKWKLVVDIGESDDSANVTVGTGAATTSTATSGDPQDTRSADIKNEQVTNAEANTVVSFSTAQVVSVPAEAASAAAQPKRDARSDEVLSILAEFMPSDAQSGLGPYLPGFMSLRLLLLRQSRSNEEFEIVRTMLDSYSSYTASGRQRSDIAVMLARDFIFMSQQQQQQPPFLSLDGSNMMGSSQVFNSSSNNNFSVFGLPSTNSTYQNSPALAPIPVPGSNDSMSVVSN